MIGHKRRNESYGISREPAMIALALFVIAILIIFILYPLFSIMQTSFQSSDGTWSLQSYVDTLQNKNFGKAFSNTMRLGLTTGLFSTLVGFFYAYTLECVKSPLKPFLRLVEILPLITPPFVLSFSAIMLLGKRGLITYGLLGLKKWNIYGFHGLVIVQTMSFFPIASMTFEGLFQNFDVSMEEAARNMGAGRVKVFLTVTLPMMLSGIANVFLLSFIESVTDFSNPTVLGGGYTTLATQVYVQAIGNYNIQAGTTYAMILLLVTVAAFTLQKAFLDKRSFVTLTGKATREREMIADRSVSIPCNAFCIFVCAAVLLFYVFMILGGFFAKWGADYTLVLDNFEFVLSRSGKPIGDTLLISLLVAPLCSLLSVMIGYLIVRKRFTGRGFIEFVSLFGMAVPGTVFGLGYILSFNTPPILLTNTLTILVIVLVMTRLPVGVRSSIAALRQIDPSIEEAASNLGANATKVFGSVTVPLIKPSFFSSWVFSFIKSMTAISAVIFLVSANYNLLTVRVMQHVDKGQFGYACALSTVLIVIVLLVVTLMRAALKRMGVSSDVNDLMK